MIWERLDGVIHPGVCRATLELIDRHYLGIDQHETDPAFSRYSSSARLFSVPGIEHEDWCRTLAKSKILRTCQAALGGNLAIDVDQCWVRRQYAMGNYPPLHAPHSWHQDGALAFDFYRNGAAASEDALLEMMTCWIPLTPCGVDAPGLELITTPVERLVPPSLLADPQLGGMFANENCQQPRMNPGDALLFRGSVLHRTFVTPEMTRDRTSIELRLFPADRLPPRLIRDRFAALGGP